MARQAKGLGRKPHRWRGRWRAYVTTGYAADGEAERKYVYGKTLEACIAKIDEARRRLKLGQHTSNMPLSDYLDSWLESKSLEVEPRTAAIYAAELEHVRAHLGRERLSKLTPAHVKRMMRAIVGSKVTFGTNQAAVLTPRSANAARNVLHNALADAVLDGLIELNPASKERVRPLKGNEREIVVWTAREVRVFVDTCAAGGASLHAFFYTALTTGMRVGELSALTWRDVTDTTIQVRATGEKRGAKTDAGNRVLSLSADTADVLRRHRLVLEAEGVKSPLVFPTGNGRQVTRQHARTSLLRWARLAGVTPLSPHGLRHTYASMMIAAGANPAELARLLGHSSAAFTLRTYVHFFERARKREAPTLQELMGSDAIGGNLGGIRATPN